MLFLANISSTDGCGGEIFRPPEIDGRAERGGGGGGTGCCEVTGAEVVIGDVGDAEDGGVLAVTFPVKSSSEAVCLSECS